MSGETVFYNIRVEPKARILGQVAKERAVAVGDEQNHDVGTSVLTHLNSSSSTATWGVS